MNITINIVELAAELAELELNNTYTNEIQIYVEDEHGTRYTEEAQDLFDDLYDKYFTLIKLAQA